MNLPSFLDEQAINYRLSTHAETYRWQDLAQIEHISGRNVVKPVVVKADGPFVSVRPAVSYKVDLMELRTQLRVQGSSSWPMNRN